MLNKEKLEELYNEIELWIMNDENYYIEFKKIKYSVYKIRKLVRTIIDQHDFSEYKTSVMYRKKVTQQLHEEYKNEEI